MLEIKDTSVYGLEESIIASGYAMTTEPYDYTQESNDLRYHDEPSRFNKHLKRAIKLAKCGGGSGHSNFRTGIIVQFDVKYPQYISPEMQRYHFLQIITSQSKMHRLLKMNLDEMCNKYVERETIDIVNHLISNYNLIADEKSGRDYTAIPLIVELRNGEKIECHSKEEALYTIWMQILSNCPLGLEMWMRVSLNYEQLSTIYKQRRHHRLKEDWGAFCDWIETLPYAKELIICED